MAKAKVAAPEAAAGVPAKFRVTLLAAAQAARQLPPDDPNHITMLQYGAIWAATLVPSRLAKVQAYVVHEATLAGKMPPQANPEAFDWSALLAFIQQLLPIILQIISIFTPHMASAAGLIVLAIAVLCCGSLQAQCRRGSCPVQAPAVIHVTPTVVSPCDADQCPAPALTAAEAAALCQYCPMGPLTAEQVKRAYTVPTRSVLVRGPLFSPGVGCWWDRGPLRRLVSTPWRGRPALRR